MKGISSVIMCLLFSLQILQGQVDTSTTEEFQNNISDYYSLKHKKQKKTGWILLGTGVPAALIGVLISNPFGAHSAQGSIGIGLAAVGLSASIASIPFFISSGTNKKIVRRLNENDLLNSDQEKFNFYNLKYKKQRTAGWFLLGGGLTLGITGFLLRANNGSRSGSGFLIAGGIVSSLVSIPLFISSGTNKKIAKAHVGRVDIGFNQLPDFKSTFVSVGILINI